MRINGWRKGIPAMLPADVENGKHTSPSATVASYLSSLGLSGPSADNYLKADHRNNPLLSDTGSDFTIGSNFSSPSATQCPFAVVNGVNGLTGLTYSFDFNGARFILLDQFSPSNGAWYYSAMEGAIGGTSNATSMINGYTGSGYATNIASYAAFFGNPANGPAGQQPWINQQLSGRTGQHTFVFAHKGLLTGNHQDTLFTASSSGATGQTNSANPSYNAAAQNNFFSSLCNNGVRMYINGHDHMHDRSIVTSPDGKSTVMQLTCASDSSKFYGPQGAGTNCASVSAYTAVTPATTPPPIRRPRFPSSRRAVRQRNIPMTSTGTRTTRSPATTPPFNLPPAKDGKRSRRSCTRSATTSSPSMARWLTWTTIRPTYPRTQMCLRPGGVRRHHCRGLELRQAGNLGL